MRKTVCFAAALLASPQALAADWEGTWAKSNDACSKGWTAEGISFAIHDNHYVSQETQCAIKPMKTADGALLIENCQRGHVWSPAFEQVALKDGKLYVMSLGAPIQDAYVLCPDSLPEGYVKTSIPTPP